MRRRIVEEFDNYRITEDGRVFNSYGKELSQQLSNSGYKQVTLRDASGAGHSRFIHRLLAVAFIPNPEHKPCVNHKDGNRLNNDLDNLEWCTHKENSRHAFNTGLATPHGCNGESHGRHKLTDENVAYIMRTYVKGSREFGSSALARQLGVSTTTVYKVVHGKAWRCLSD